ncbi:MAG: transcription termination/antitermination protein NusG [Treponema sp.]|jgi:transcriptional antiterminator NusG|nr:transcription termination/antitermination protein NusG [Treponema sp.]
MATGWYVLHVYSGFENKIEKTIHLMRSTGELDANVVKDIKVPNMSIVEIKNGKKRTQTRKFLPGYILVEMDLSDDGWKAPCSKIRQINGVTAFVGTPPNKKPQPLSADEARAILQKTGEIKGEKPSRPSRSFNPHEQVKIIDGPFESFIGVIEEVNPEKNKLKVMIGIFGRKTPVEVDFSQVEKV